MLINCILELYHISHKILLVNHHLSVKEIQLLFHFIDKLEKKEVFSILMEILSQHGITSKMIGRSKRLTSLAVMVTAGTLCSYTHFRNFYLASPLSASNDDNWLNKFLTTQFKGKKLFLSEKAMNTVLRCNEYTNKCNKGSGRVSWFETNHLKANNPLEDRHSECYLNFNDAYLFGIFDGHSGWYCSEGLRTRLPEYVSLALLTKELRKKFLLGEIKSADLVDYLGEQSEDELSLEFLSTFEEKQNRLKTGSSSFVKALNDIENLNGLNIVSTFKHVYLALDRDITIEAIPDGTCNEPIWSGLSGAVAISAYIKEKDLYVSNTGDCRAVLGVNSSDGWFDVPMSLDHVVGNKNEVKRLKEEHPNEKMVIYRDRLLGQLQPLRSFGDVAYKWSVELHRKVLDVLYGQPIVSKSIYLTPPYLTAEPEVSYEKLEDDVKFLILATDGLWDNVSNEMAVKIIGKYLDDLRDGAKPAENGATQLIRYSLGQGNNKKLRDMLSIPAEMKRDFHDDITVTVVYFDEERTQLKSKL